MPDSDPVASSSRVMLDAQTDKGCRPSEIPSSPPAATRPPHERAGRSPSHSARVMSPAHQGKGKEREACTPERARSPGRPTSEMSDSEDREGEYELRRQHNIRQNQLLFDSLGIASLNSLVSPNPPNTSSGGPSKHKKTKGLRGPKGLNKAVYDRSGHIVSLPGPGERHRIACVEMPADRLLNKRIAEGEYTDVTHWWEGEERRWRFGRGKGVLKEGEEEEVGGVTKTFRWRQWTGLENESRMELKAREDSNRRDTKGKQPDTAGQSAYSLFTGNTCHQCRRKSDKPKMKCRNVDPVCRAVFCETCCKRYSYFEFDPYSRSFICPLCKDCCNCANCIRKRHLSHLLGPGKLGLKTKTMQKEGMTVQAWLEKAQDDTAELPFDRVRIVDQAFDVVSPALPSEEPPATEQPVKSKKRKARPPKEPRPKKVKKSRADEDGSESNRKVMIKFKVPRRHDGRKVKAAGLERGTVGRDSDDDGMASDASSTLTSLDSTPTSLDSSSTSAAVPSHATTPRSPLLPHTNDYLAAIAGKSLPHSKPDMPTIPNPSAFDLPRSYPTQDGLQGSVRRRKPPPAANILRAPKHASFSPPEVPQRALPGVNARDDLGSFSAQTTVSQPWQDPPPHPIQTFSYDGYSSTPPAFYPTIQPNMLHSMPPPYSHSPPSRRSALGSHGPYASFSALQSVVPRAGTPPVPFALMNMAPSSQARAPGWGTQGMLGLEEMHDASRIHAWLEGSPSEG